MFYDDAIIDLNILQIPHPKLYYRNFVLVPFNQIAPNFYQYLNESYRIGNFKSLNKQVNDWKPDKNDSNYLNLDFQITNSSKNSIL